jgi:uncharacterized protein (UPF0147 family)
LAVTQNTDGNIPGMVLLDNDVTVPAQQHVTSTESTDLEVTQNTDGKDMTTKMTDKDTEKGIAHDTTQMAIPQNSANEGFEATYTFEVESDVTNNRTDQLPSTSIHVLEEISTDENIGMVDRENEQYSTAADREHDAL